MSDLKIPEFKALDFSGLAGIGDSYLAARKQKTDEQDKETQRKYVENQDRKLSADMARQAWEDQHKLDLETSKQLLPGSDFWRAAQMSSGLGNQVGAPYGISVGEDKKVQLPADNATPSDAAAAQFLKSGAQQPQAPLQGPTPSGKPLTEEDQKNAELLNFKPPEQPDATTGAPGAPDLGNIDALAAEKESHLPVTRSMYATVRGQRIEAPKEDPVDFFPGEPKYNDMVREMVATGRISEKDAIARADHTRSVDIGQGGLATRAAAALGQKQNTQLTREEQQAALHDRLAQSNTNSVRGAGARVQSAEILAGGGGGLPEPKVANSYLGFVKEATSASGAKIDQTGMRLHDRISAELSAGNPSPVAQATAIHTLTAMSLSSSGGTARVLKSAIDDIKAAPGLVNSTKNQAYQLLNNGENMPEVVDMYRRAGEILRQVGTAQAQRDFQSIDRKVGRGSPFYRDPGLRATVEAQMDGVHQNLGLGPLPLDDGEQGAPAPEAAPAPAARHPHAHAAPAAHAAGPAPMDDAAAVKMAQARYDKDPNDAVAKQVLKMHGLLK